MDEKLLYLQNLVHLARADKELHPRERDCILEVAHRLGIAPRIALHLLDEPLETPQLPTDPLIRYSLLNDLFNLAACDGVIKEEETTDCKKIASSLGFDPEVVDHLVESLKKHLSHGYHKNAIKALIYDELHKETVKNFSHDKYN
ncbi:MAG: hypothetical protein PWR20_1423 [Bacteroidales bacterium]|jgi:uncharacterized tellurite resistance protein B-like protein|nr:hypothetical protein [Bacteroidales bacterium]MDN5329665.1 hypothetical protein [Bacteroidales bacterium]